MVLPMKYQLVIIFLLMFFFQKGISQSEPREIKYFRYEKDFQANSFYKAYETETSYDIFGNISTKVIKFNLSDGTNLIWKRENYEYNNLNLLERFTSRRYNQEVDLWITTFWVDYKYDQNGCLIEEQRTKNIGGQIDRRVTYTRNSNCRITSELEEWLGNGFDLSTKDFYIRDYHSDGISYDEKFYNYTFVGDSLYQQKDRKVIYDQNENIIEADWIIFTSLGDTLIDAKNTYEYDEYNNVLLNSEYRKNQNSNDLELTIQFVYEYLYDDNGYLKEKKREYWDYENPSLPFEIVNYRRKYVYQNSCDGLVEEYTQIDGQVTGENRYEFIYEGINECLDLENLDLQISIFPNPSHGEIEITSPIFQTGNTDILVLSIDGKVLLQKTENKRSAFSKIDLSLFSNGFYLIQLRNGNHFVKEKIIIAK